MRRYESYEDMLEQEPEVLECADCGTEQSEEDAETGVCSECGGHKWINPKQRPDYLI